jgi:hypothetical protein
VDTRLSHRRPRFELGRGIVVECGVTPPPIIEHLDVLEDVPCRLVPCTVLALIDEFALQCPEDKEVGNVFHNLVSLSLSRSVDSIPTGVSFTAASF